MKHFVLTLFVLTNIACDFDIPDKFEMPTWYLDLKIPLVQTRYQMTDISDSTAGIFSTDDSLGFKIVQEGEMPSTELPSPLPSVPLGLNQEISSGEIPGVDNSLIPELPALLISERINVVLYDQAIYPDTTDYTIDTTIVIGTDPLTGDDITVDTTILIADVTPFSFPTTETKVMSAENYNSLIVALFDSAMGLLAPLLDRVDTLGLDKISIDDPPIIASVDTLVIKSHETNSTYLTSFKNNIPTELSVYSQMVTGDIPAFLTDTLANHNLMPTLQYGETYSDTTNLSGKGLTNYLKLATNMSLAPATDFVTIPPGSLYIDFNLKFQMAGIDSIDITTNEYSLSDGIDMPPMELPEMNMEDQGITRMEIYRNELKDADAAQNDNKLIITNLASTFPFEMNFLMNFKNFSPSAGNDSVKIDTVLKKGISINKIFDMRGYTLQSVVGDNDGDNWPDSAFTSFDLVLDITIPEQKASIPFDGNPLGEFTMNMQLDQLSFSSIGADIFMQMPSEPTEQDFPAGFTGAVPTEAMIQLIFKNQIELPIQMNMDFNAYNSLGELTYLPVTIPKIGYPPFNSSATDTSMTVVTLNKLGTTIDIFKLVSDSLPDTSIFIPPCDTCATIIDLLASNPEKLIIDPEVKVDGKGAITPGKAIAGGFKVTIPFVLQLSPMAFMGGTPTPVAPFPHETSYKIRNSLLETSLVSSITNALPFGAEVSVLLSNYAQFPTDTSREQLNFFRDTLVSQSLLQADDSLYIIRNCSDLSLDSGDIYIFNLMTDFSECIDGMPYIIRSKGSGTDTVFSFVDTLFNFELPEPESFYEENDTSGYPQGMVALPGTSVHTSTIDTSQIFLITGTDTVYTMPRFYLPGTGNRGVFISNEDYLEISSFITFTLSSSGTFGTPQNELILTYPNGGETLYTNETCKITWKSLGAGSESVDLYYSVAGDTNTYKPSFCKATDNWVLIQGDLDNSLEYDWNLADASLTSTDSLRIKIIASNGESCDINGHYVKIRDPGIILSKTNPKEKIDTHRK